MSNDALPRWPLKARDWIAAGALAVLLAVLIGGGILLHAREMALREARAREVAAAARAALPRRAPPITTSIYVRAVPVRHAQ